MIRVLIVDDSRVAQEFLAHVLAADPDIEVAGFAGNATEALAAARQLRPDVITMDIHMPLVDGFRATRAIMENVPVPIVIVSASSAARQAPAMFRALEAGALTIAPRPPGIADPGYEAAVREFIQTVKTMSEIKVIKRYPRISTQRATAPLGALVPKAPETIQLVAIGASIGGPPALNTILSLLPPDLPVPVLIVQHIAPGFVSGFVDWLVDSSGIPLHIATNGQQPEPGHGYVAPDDFHMGVESGGRIVLSNHAPEHGSRPSVAYLFRTVAQVFGARAVGVLLTGMGRDGADGLKLLRDRGGVTIAQDEATSVVHGMPGEAIKLGAATYILPPEAIAHRLVKLISSPNGRGR